MLVDWFLSFTFIYITSKAFFLIQLGSQGHVCRLLEAGMDLNLTHAGCPSPRICYNRSQALHAPLW